MKFSSLFFPSRAASLMTLLAATVSLSSILNLKADDALFYGNSYTQGANVVGVQGKGGLPKLVEEVADSKGKKLSTKMMAVGGKNWAFHLAQPGTFPAMSEKSWNWVVLQDYSTEPTHIGNVDSFKASGMTFYQKIHQLDPQATVVLYETWAHPVGAKLYGPVSSKTQFANPTEMEAELVKNYADLAKTLEDVDPGNQVLVAPVGEAFARSLEKYPDMKLHGKDFHHANAEGIYLAALVIYATLYNDNPVGAASEFPGFKIDPTEATELQGVAQEVIATHAKPLATK